MVCCSTGASRTHVRVLDVVLPLSRWMERHVLLDNLPLDFRYLEILQCHGLCIRIPYCGLFWPGRSLSIQFWQRFKALP